MDTLETHQQVYMCFVDSEKAFDHDPRKVLQGVLQEYTGLIPSDTGREGSVELVSEFCTTERRFWGRPRHTWKTMSDWKTLIKWVKDGGVGLLGKKKKDFEALFQL